MTNNMYKNKAVIYKLTAPNGKAYIGQTVNFKKRMVCYRTANCKGQHKIFNSILKYGFDNFKVEVIEEVEMIDNYITKLNELEIFYIAKYQTLEKGLNLSYGGHGTGRHTKEVKDKISKVHKNKIVSEEARLKISNSNKGHQRRLGAVLSKETRNKISKVHKGENHPFYGKVRRETTKAKIAEAHRGKTKESKIVDAYRNGVFVKQFKNAKEASKELEIPYKTSLALTKGERSEYQGYTFNKNLTGIIKRN